MGGRSERRTLTPRAGTAAVNEEIKEGGERGRRGKTRIEGRRNRRLKKGEVRARLGVREKEQDETRMKAPRTMAAMLAAMALAAAASAQRYEVYETYSGTGRDITVYVDVPEGTQAFFRVAAD